MNTESLGVTRYPLPVPEWTRLQWASEDARDLWEPRLSRIAAAWEAAERASVGTVRQIALQSVPPASLPFLHRMAATKALEVLVLGQQGQTGSYQSKPVPVEEADDWSYRVALATRDAALEFVEAWDSGDDETIGRLLGFPQCCRDFYQRVWVDDGWIDTTWPMAGGETTVEGPTECNILLRWLGVRLVPHLPCSFDCEATAELGERMADLMQRGFAQEARWVYELLDSPVEWSAWHGIAEIKTPIVTVSAKTDATPDRLVVRRKGSTYPEAGAAGVRFPYHREPEALRVDETEWADNGFASLEAMRRAHYVIASVAPSLPLMFVLDLGCGDGTLSRLLAGEKGLSAGVERDGKRAARARQQGTICAEARIGDVRSWPDYRFDLVVLMPGRLVEMDDEEAALVRFSIRKHTALLVYAYGDWLDRYGSLAGLCEAAGMDGYLEGRVEDEGVSAAMWRWA